MIAFIFIALYLLSCIVIGSIGSGKKIGFWGSFFIALLFSPVIGLIVVLVSGAPTMGSDNIKYIVKADKAIQKRDIPSAITHLNQSLHYNANPVSHYKLATCYSLMEDKKKAMQHLSKAVEMGYSSFDKIETDHLLEWLRDQPGFSEFADNGYQLSISEPKDHIAQLKDLAELRKNDAITEEEYATQKAKLLSN